MSQHTQAHDDSLRSVGSVVASIALAAGVCLLPLIPAVRGVLRVTWHEVTIAMSVFAVTMIAGAFVMPRYGRASRVGDTFDSVETMLIQGAVLWLVFASGRGDSFFWVLWLTHAMLVGASGAKIRFNLSAFAVSAAVLALAFLALHGDGGSAALSVVIGSLGCYVQWIGHTAARRLAEADAERARLAAELAETRVLAERQRIARDIHDSLGSDLAAIDWRLRGLRGEASVASEVDELVARLGQGTNELRAIVWALRTPARKWGEVVDYVTQRATDLAGNRIALSLRADGDRSIERPGEVAIEFLRAVLELVHNATRHSSAATLVVSLNATGTALAATVEDDGKGLPADVESRDEGGLANLRARVAKARGHLELARLSPGTRISLSLPLA